MKHRECNVSISDRLNRQPAPAFGHPITDTWGHGRALQRRRVGWGMGDDSVARAIEQFSDRLNTVAAEAADHRERISAQDVAFRQGVIARMDDLATRVSALELLARTAMVRGVGHGPPKSPPAPQELVEALNSPLTGSPIAVPLDVPGIGPVVVHVDPDPTADAQLEMSGVVTSLRQHRSHIEESRGQHPSHAARVSGGAARGHSERPPGR